MKILFVDFASIPEGHHDFNAITIKAIAGSPLVSWIGYCADKTQAAGVANLLQRQFVQPFEIYSPPEKAVRQTRVSLGIQLIKRYAFLFEIIRKKQPDRIVFLAVDYLIWPVLASIFVPRIRKHHQCEVYAILHSVYPIVSSRVKHWIWQRLFDRVEVGPIVLATTVAGKFEAAFPHVQVSVWPIPHYLDLYNGSTNYQSDPVTYHPQTKLIKLLMAGRQAAYSLHSGFAHFLFQECAQVKVASNFLLCVYVLTSGLPENYQMDDSSAGHIVWKDGRLSTEEYRQLFSEIDLVIFPLESAQEYEYRASSLLSDAITFLKPIIAPRSGIFAATTCQADGPIGWLYSSYEELSQILSCLAELSLDDYRELQARLLYLRSQISIHNTSPLLWDIVGINRK